MINIPETKYPIYLDNQASTPCDPLVIAKMTSILETEFGNPHSADHWHGWNAANTIKDCRRRIGYALGAEESEVIFCSGATEANNLAIRGIARRNNSKRFRIIVSSIEHKSVLETALSLQPDGFEVEILPVDYRGVIDTDALTASLRDGPAFVSIGWVNSELGVIQNIDHIADLCKSNGAILHVDGAQAVGRIDIDFGMIGADLFSVSAHKAYGPKGIGALLVRREVQTKLSPIIYGGGQEGGLRSGTVSTFLAAGLAEACEIASASFQQDEHRIRPLRDKIADALRHADPDCKFNGDQVERIAGNINVTFSTIDADQLITQVANQLSISRASACNAGSIVGSHVLRSIGHSDDSIRKTVRLCIGRFTTDSDIESAIKIMTDAVNRLQGNPLS